LAALLPQILYEWRLENVKANEIIQPIRHIVCGILYKINSSSMGNDVEEGRLKKQRSHLHFTSAWLDGCYSQQWQGPVLPGQPY
jgi:hypothetical protein